MRETGPWRTRLPQLALTHVAGTANIIAVFSMAPVISAAFGLTATQFGLFVTFYYAAQAVFSVPSGAITDRLGVGWAIALAHLIMAGAAAMMALGASYQICLGAAFLMGVGYSLTNPSTARGVTDWFPATKRGLAMGLKQVGVPIGGLMGAGVGVLAARFDWQGLMWGVALFIGLSGMVCLTLIPPSRRGAEPPRSALKNISDVAQDRNLGLYCAASGITNMGQTNFFGFLTLFLTEAARMGQTWVSLALGLAQAVSAISRIMLGAISDRAFGGNRRLLMVWVTGLAALFTVAMVVVEPVYGLYTGVALTLLLGVTIAAVAPVAQAITVELTEPQLAGSATGYSMLFIHGFSMLAPLMFGYAVDTWGSFGVGWVATGLVMAVGTALLLVAVRYPRPS